MDVFYIDGRKLYYADQGCGRAVLVLHGAYLVVEDSRGPTVKALVEAGYRAIYPHRAGRGESDPHPIFLSLARDCRDCWALLDHLGIRRVVLVGHSQGAYVAREMLLTQSTRVAGIVTEDSGALGKLGTETIAKASIERFDDPTGALYEKWRETLSFIDRAGDYPSDYNVQRLLARRCRIRKEDEWKYQQVPDPDDSPVPEGAYCTTPALIYSAGRGRIHPQDPEVQELRGRIPATDYRLVIVPDSGHAIHEEQFDVFIQHLLDFLGSLPPESE